MRPALLDVNVLVALAWPTHIHHTTARRWFLGNASADWATCAITQLGFLRVSCNPSIVGEAVSAAEAQRLLGELTGYGAHSYWQELPSVSTLPRSVADSIAGHRQVTDAYLLQLAIDNGGRLATLDRGIAELAQGVTEAEEAVVVVG